MSKAIYWQRGETIDYKNLTDKKIDANTILVIGSRIGIAGTEILPNETGSLHVTGVFKMDKKPSEAITAGAEVYFDSTAGTITATVSASGVKAGFAVEAAAADDAGVAVKINA